MALFGSTYQPSRTRALLDALVVELEQRLLAHTRILQIGDLALPLGQALSRDELPQDIQGHLRSLESAGPLIAALPVYRRSYPGHFKHLFDLVIQEALVDKPVLLAATGGSERHALVLDHQLRPLFSNQLRGVHFQAPAALGEATSVDRVNPTAKYSIRERR